VNPDGTPENLVAAHPANTNAVRSGVWSRTGRVLEPRAREIADALLAEPHTAEIDALGALEIGRVLAIIEAIDRDLEQRGLTRKSGEPRKLLELRERYSRRLESWLGAYGATPAARASWAARLAGSSLADEIRERQRAIEGQGR
jgi:hypothetical protein